MSAIIKPSTLINAYAPPIQDMIDAIENKCADYILVHHTLPRFLYLNTVLWEDVMLGLLRTVELYGLDVVTHPDIPYGHADLSHDYKEPKLVAHLHKRMAEDVDEAIARGQISID